MPWLVGAVLGAVVAVSSAPPVAPAPPEPPAGAVDVDWNKGGGPQAMRRGLPNPPGWYRAAVGPQTKEKVLYLTFDDGPSVHTPRLLAALHRHRAHATFFVAGGPAKSHPAVIKRMHRDGHAIGNHTWWHPRLTQVTTKRVRTELRSTQRAVGSAMAPCMRPPYGLIDQRVAKAAIGAGFQPVMWTAHIEDWSPHPLSWTIARLRKDTKPGAVILMHDTHGQTVTAVQRLLPWWKKHGWRLEVVPACR
ncbi:MAG: polysaccharide deacetylase family protein [Candidatus Nanopelagicales bacterium]